MATRRTRRVSSIVKPSVRRYLPFAVDALAILAFATFGRRSHQEGVSVAGVLSVAWPFLAGWAVGATALGVWRHPGSPGLAARAFAVALPVAFALRAVSGRGLAIAFVIVAVVTTGLLLVGRRLLVRW